MDEDDEETWDGPLSPGKGSSGDESLSCTFFGGTARVAPVHLLDGAAEAAEVLLGRSPSILGCKLLGNCTRLPENPPDSQDLGWVE